MIADEDFTWAMKEAVAERGADYVYPKFEEGYTVGIETCVYQTPTGEPACLIGLAMSKLGLELPPHNVEEGASRVLEETGLSQVARNAADRAQAEQDHGRTWGRALETYLLNL